MARTVTVGTGIEIAYERYGDPRHPVLLMIHGFGVPLTGWHPDLLRMLTDGGLSLVVFDNRDVGASTQLTGIGPTDPTAVLGGVAEPAYLLDDMAQDAAGLLTALRLDSAHVLGVSLGGMIAQQLAISHPDRVRSLTSVMSTPAHGLAPNTAEAAAALLQPPGKTREAAIERAIRVSAVIGSTAYERDEAWTRRSAGTAWDRNTDLTGTTRQFAAISFSPDRRPGLAGLDVPTLVIHGAEDPLIGLAGGQATAEAVPGAELMVIPGMRHDLPRAVWPQVVQAVLALVQRAEAQRVRQTHAHARWGRLTTDGGDA